MKANPRAISPPVLHDEMLCPVCRGSSRLVRDLPSQATIVALQQLTQCKLPTDVVVKNYQLRRCLQCELEFSSPLLPADNSFYEWLNQEYDYYTGERWEWDQVTELVKAHVQLSGTCSVLELGAGTGTFLRQLRQTSGARVAAIERSDDAVRVLTGHSIEAYRPDQAETALVGQRFDFVVAFHCLEHVADPLGLVHNMCSWAGDHGRIFVSVPYSPMFYESAWFDPLNHPPHHMTRWNKSSLTALATQVGKQIHLSMPPAFSLTARARMSLCIVYQGPRWYRHPRRARLIPFAHPILYLIELIRQGNRDRINGQHASDVVLAELVR